MLRRSLVLPLSLAACPVSWAAAQRAAPAGPARDVPAAVARAPRFEVEMMWPKPMPNRWILGSSTGVAVDARDHIFVVHLTDSFNQRTEMGSATTPPTGECCTPAPNVLEFDAGGTLVNHWGGPGAGYDWPEQNAGIAVDDSGYVWIGGAGGQDSRILKFTRDGKFVAEFGKQPPAPTLAAAPGRGADTAYQGVSPGRGGRGRGARVVKPSLPPNSTSMESFGGPAGFAFDTKAGEVFVADGYRNHRVAVIDMQTGAIKRFWGAYGKPPVDADSARYSPSNAAAKQFGPVRCVELAKDGLLYVCDPQNDRIQVFKKDGSFVTEKTIMPNTLGLGAVWDIALSRDPQQAYLYVADGQNMQIHVLDRKTLAVLRSFGDGGRQPGQFYAPHSLATDSKGNLYTTETYEGKRVQKFDYKGVAPVTAKDPAVVWPSKASGGKR
ncbi:MAG TPA: NHL repeat-containing protein [Gemmatimonadaceae bacterium]|nr:NHL repeat-containing protein [Gemmatimonadaceae bacterium]